MSVPTRVLENGQWVTRYLDPYQLLAQSRTQQDESIAPMAEPAQAPSYAILSQTLVRSPVIRGIHPARLRHHTRNDVLFISADTIHIKEVKRDYSFESVLVNSDFDSMIRTSGVFGLPRKSKKPVLSPLIKREDKDSWLHDFDEIELAERKYSEHIFQDDFDPQASGARDCKTADNRTQHPVHRHLPPEIVILVLESARLVFMYAVSGSSCSIDLVTSSVPLPFSTSRLHQLGEHLAIDPKYVL